MSDEGMLQALLEELLCDIARKPRVLLPAIVGIDASILARWLYRAWLRNSGVWGPFVSISRKHLPGDDIIGWESARGGLLFLDTHPAPATPLYDAIEEGQLKLLVPGEGDAIRVPLAERSRLVSMDVYHDLATDPALARVRRSLLSHCRSASPVPTVSSASIAYLRSSSLFWGC